MSKSLEVGKRGGMYRSNEREEPEQTRFTKVDPNCGSHVGRAAFFL